LKIYGVSKKKRTKIRKKKSETEREGYQKKGPRSDVNNPPAEGGGEFTTRVRKYREVIPINQERGED